jgi:hypothetical protein
MKPMKYKASDYSWTIRKDIEKNPNTGKYDVTLRVIEFDIEYDFETAEEAEKNAEKIIAGLINTRAKHQNMELPIPLIYSKEFTGRLTLRLSPELHKKLYIEAEQENISLNKLIEKKLG